MPFTFFTRFKYFNPRSHERSDAIPTIPTSKKLLFQSTLPREERQNFLLLLKFGIRYFNPRSHERSDLAHKSFPSHQVFQSTLPREERLNAVYFFHTLQIFQSTLPREERRNPNDTNFKKIVISIHAPTRGATKLFVAVKVWYPIFQSTLPREERLST